MALYFVCIGQDEYVGYYDILTGPEYAALRRHAKARRKRQRKAAKRS